jgi:hypothetical protein
VIRPLAGLFFLEKLRFVEYEPDTHKDVLTYLADPYLDLSFPGVVLFNLALGFYATYVFRRYEAGHDDAIVTWGLIACCLVMAPFANFVNTFVVWFFWVTNWFLTAPRQVAKETKDG